MGLYGTSKINEQGRLEIGGADTSELAQTYGTPLYVYDVKDIRNRAEAFKKAFDAESVDYQVAYASKAFSCLAMFQLADELGLSLDVCSGGELYTALEAEFPVERIHFHGNNKTPDELEMAVRAGIGCIVADNFTELTWLMGIAEAEKKIVNVLLRITPGVEAHTHEYISTGQEDSKFGFDLNSGQAKKAIELTLNHDYIHLQGVHSHIGSQIFRSEGFEQAVKEIYRSLAVWKDELGYYPEVLNVGGGFGIRYNKHDEPLPLESYIEPMVTAAREEAAKIGENVPEIWIEPGRALVGEAGTTIYTIGSRKDIPHLRTYLSVDGGMTDNIRPALYQAEYEAVLANKADRACDELVSIAGRCCESGDMLIWDLQLPKSETGDLLAVASTGAYGYAMASNYNRMLRPAVVFVENGEHECVIERESYTDLLRNEHRYSKTAPKAGVTEAK
ncbi:diaminopimelate decarboxylase [Salisediminibacterium halotolerans]|uniref:Diaminopimelate decarboxylase n=1 Tax=Salisediminibacterium halotolerans TaxID=517425 RepID=A0A1H9P924_9BACI|nr:diaminopimelate decarboxylase [Salisediminibacterium haloalkalitolerans]SER44706.1 diaminopimelate decarboxylase [Salisediminibacterium haloalkalitolerans]